MIYLGKGGQISYLDKSKIIAEVDDVLGECWNGEFPVNVEEICDELNLGILPIPNLNRSFYIDAYISADFKKILVDGNEFKKESPRYRFSVAHELGHYLLHRKYYPDELKDFDEWLKVSQSIMNNYAEFQANFFAANLLVPSEEFRDAMNGYYNGDFVKNVWSASSSEQGKILSNVRRRFRVSDEVIARRIGEVFPEIEKGAK